MRFLKVIAEDNKDHQRALEYKIKEMPASRWHKNGTWEIVLLEFPYWLFSNYGRSTVRPIIWLIVFSALLAGYYAKFPWTWEAWARPLECARKNVLPILGSNRQVLNDCAVEFKQAALFTEAHSVMSVVLLFLLGLALRNRFRL